MLICKKNGCGLLFIVSFYNECVFVISGETSAFNAEEFEEIGPCSVTCGKYYFDNINF